jgi:hypothetical protein
MLALKMWHFISSEKSALPVAQAMPLSFQVAPFKVYQLKAE